MRRRNSESRKLIVLIVVLFVLSLGIGYAVLTEKLTINNAISYDSMKWDVGFTSVEDGWESYVDAYIGSIEKEYGVTLEEMGVAREELEEMLKDDLTNDGIIYAPSSANISSDKKSITVNCELEASSKSQICFVKTTITNASTFYVALSENPIITYDDTYIEAVEFLWLSHDLYGILGDVVKNQTLDINENADFIIGIKTRELTVDTLPSNGLSVPITISLNFKEAEVPISQLAMLTSHKDDFAFWSETYREKIKNITFEDKINIPSNAVESWDISLVQNGKVMSYVVPNENDSSYYDLYIQSDTQLYANFNMSDWFANFFNVDSINGLELLDTSYTTNMYSMFKSTGSNSTNFTLNVSNFDTRNVTNMSYMFGLTGSNSTVFTLDLSNFDTSNVTDMSYMFMHTGSNSTNFMLDVSNFDTSNVTDVRGMFYYTGSCSSRLNTSITIKNPNVIEYYDMFYQVAIKSGSKITVNYTSETSELVDKMIATKSSNSNVVKGVRVD